MEIQRGNTYILGSLPRPKQVLEDSMNLPHACAICVVFRNVICVFVYS